MQRRPPPQLSSAPGRALLSTLPESFSFELAALSTTASNRLGKKGMPGKKNTDHRFGVASNQCPSPIVLLLR
jgi:hypothetical protein